MFGVMVGEDSLLWRVSSQEQRTENHPQYLSGLSRALFPTTFLEIAVNVLN